MADPLALDPGLLAQSAAGDNSAPVSVSELSGRLKRHVEDAFGHVRVRGEISGWKRVSSGHCYLCLKDDAATIDGVLWRTSALRLAFAPADGAEVVATGRLTTFPGRSKYQIIIDKLELAGEGAMLALLEKLRLRLAREGLFDAGRKRPLPYLPRVIGVVTSPTGAVIRDILHRLADRFPTRVIIWPVVVQGPGASEQIARAVSGFNADEAGTPTIRPDLIIVARGGGSVEDLWPFNDEAVARAVAASAIPVISAVGHETDTTLCDFAADVRAPTPTAAAELAVPVRRELVAHVEQLSARTLKCANRYRSHGVEKLAALAPRLPSPDTLLGGQRQRVDDLGERLRRGLGKRLADARGELAGTSGAMRPSLLTAQVARGQARLTAARLDPKLVTQQLRLARERLDALRRLTESLDPALPLRRGYARVETRDGAVLTSASATRRTGAITIVFGDGRIDARTDATERKPTARAVRLEQGSLL